MITSKKLHRTPSPARSVELVLPNLKSIEANLSFPFSDSGDNQRLEFLGDSLLKYVTSDFLYRHFPHHHEGHLSLLKNSLVNKYTQSLVCSELGLDDYIIKATKTKYPTNEKYRADILEGKSCEDYR